MTAAGLAVLGMLSSVRAEGAAQTVPRPATVDRRVLTRIRALEDEADRIAAQARGVVDAIHALEVERDQHQTAAARAAADARATDVERAAAHERLERLRQADAMDEPLIAARLVSLYKQGRGGYARLLLGAETLQEMGRAARTISTLVQQNAGRMTARLADIAAAAEQEEALTARLAALQAAEMAELDARTAAIAAIADREAAAAALDQRRDTTAQMLGALRGAEAPAPAAPAGSTPAAPFAAFKGALDWPVVGPVATRFASGRRQAGTMGNGITISAPPGTPVVAVHAGVVTYAEPLAGFGTMVMLDHGGGFSSAYGLLRAISIRRDQRVSAGDQIGTVAEAAPGTKSALYFEVRADGRPTDPIQWLRPR